MNVRPFRDEDSTAWDEYAGSVETSTFFHLCGWRDVLTETLGSKTHYLLACEGDRVVGILPLIRVKSILGGHCITSVPGGLVADGEEEATALLESAARLLHETGARYLALRDGLRRWELGPGLGLVTNEEHCTFVLDLSDGVEGARARLRRSTRKLSKRGLRDGVGLVPAGPAEAEELDRFYPVYQQAMRERGTPTPGRGFFQSALARMPDNFHQVTIRRQDDVMGGGFVAPFKDTLYCTWSGMPRAYFDYYTSYILYWGVIDYGVELGKHKVDMGRCRRGSGTYAFKEAWGGEERVLYQQYCLNGIARPPAAGASREEDAEYRFFVRVWNRIPLWATELLGPPLRRRLPFG